MEMEGRSKQVKFNGEIHPVADLFPMLPDDELRDLAEDIKIRGQLQPIVLDKDGRILDGRNRFQACKLAGVEPTFMTYEGDDPDGYAMTVNVTRRHMSKGQLAIVVAKSLPETGKTQQDAARIYGISQQRISYACVILKHAPDEADKVMQTPPSQEFDKAYSIAKQNKDEAKADKDRVEQLRREAPDLAAKVSDGEMTFEEAVTELEMRREDKKRAERIAPIDVLVLESGGRTFAERVEAGELNWQEAEKLAIDWKKEWEEAAERNKRRIFDILAGWKALTRFLDAPQDSFNKTVLDKLGANFEGDIKKIVAEMAANATKWNGAI